MNPIKDIVIPISFVFLILIFLFVLHVNNKLEKTKQAIEINYNKITNTMPQVTQNRTASNILLGKDLVHRP